MWLDQYWSSYQNIGVDRAHLPLNEVTTYETFTPSSNQAVNEHDNEALMTIFNIQTDSLIKRD